LAFSIDTIPADLAPMGLFDTRRIRREGR
jgi:hypothetical protein